MSELTITVLRLGFLALLWLFVILAIGVLRSDLYGTRILSRRSKTAQRTAAPSGIAAPQAAAVTHPHTPAQGIPTPVGAPARPAAPPIEVHGKPPTMLVVTEGPLRGASMRLGTATILVGRAPDCTLVLEDDYSSNHHARIFPRDGLWYVEDLGSTNGTFLDDRPVTAQTLVPTGAPVQIGQSVIELRR